MKKAKRRMRVARACRSMHAQCVAHKGRFFAIAGAAFAMEVLGAVAWRRWRAHKA
jgi:hypothetical protein